MNLILDQTHAQIQAYPDFLFVLLTIVPGTESDGEKNILGCPIAADITSMMITFISILQSDITQGMILQANNMYKIFYLQL